MDALITDLRRTLLVDEAGSAAIPTTSGEYLQRSDLEELADLAAERIIRRLSEKLPPQAG